MTSTQKVITPRKEKATAQRDSEGVSNALSKGREVKTGFLEEVTLRMRSSKLADFYQA